MRIISKELVESIQWTGDSAEYDRKLSQLNTDGQPFIVVNPELPFEVLDLICIDIQQSNMSVKYKVGEGWIAKQFPSEWNGRTQIVQLPITPCSVTKDTYVVGEYAHKPDAWDLKYNHVWVYDKLATGGLEVDAVTIKYIPTAEGKKIIGIASAFVNNKFDVIFLSNNEPNADINYQHLLTKCPTAKRINGVDGILNAHKAAAELATTEMFWVVDADAYIADSFTFNFTPYIQDRNIVHIWHSYNPVNDLEYGYGGVKLFPKESLISYTGTPVDVSTSLGRTRVIKEVACETRFNTDPFNTWKSAFRECVKLAGKVIINQNNKETDDRLAIWSTLGADRENGKYAIAGATAAKEYIDANESPANINNYIWLREKFEATTRQIK
jgi:hypothetical protein